jgi:hypothetical protein
MPIPMVCDYCGESFFTKKQTYKSNHSRYHKDSCKKCISIKQRDRRIFECGVDNILAYHDATGKNIDGVFTPVSGQMAYDLFKNYDIAILFDENDYIKSTAPLPFVCNIHPEEGIQYKTWLQAKRKNGIPICKRCVLQSMKERNKFSYDFVKEEFEKKGYCLLSENYENVNEKLNFICVRHPNLGVQTTKFASIRYSLFSCSECLREYLNRENHWKDERTMAMNKNEYKKWRQYVLERDNFTCQRCGEKEAQLNVHHLYSFRDYKLFRISVWNGITLCRNCHNLFHIIYGKKIFCPEDLYEHLQNFDV